MAEEKKAYTHKEGKKTAKKAETAGKKPAKKPAARKHEKRQDVHKAHKAPKKQRTKVAVPAAELSGMARIVSYRRGRHTQTTNQFLLEIDGVDTKAKASLYIGRRVVWTSPGRLKKQIFGKVTEAHGNSGALRARFSRGLPGTAIGSKVEMK